MGIGRFLKGFAPAALYLTGIAAAFSAMGGKVRTALMMAVFLLPLRNVIEKIQSFPFGNQFIDILLAGIIIGCFVNSKDNDAETDKSTLSSIALINVIYLLLSLLRGGFYLYGTFDFNIHETRVQDWKNFSLMPLLFFLNWKGNVTKSDVWRIFTMMCLGMFAADYYTINQIHEHSSLVSRDSIHGTFQFLGPNEVAAFFNQYTIILLSVFYAFKKGRNKILLLVLILLNLYCVTFLYSRGAYLGLLAGMFILFLFKDKKMLIPLFLVLALWQSVLPQNVIDRIKETKTDTGQLDLSSQMRINIWERAFTYFKSSPIVGIGFGSFRHLGLGLKDTHNIYMKILTEQGVIGIIILIVTLFSFLRIGWQLYQKGDDDLSRALGLGFVCCVFVLMVNNLFGDRWSYLEPNAYLWIFAGLVARLNCISQNPPVIAKARNDDEVIKSAILETAPKVKKKLRYYDPPERQ